jgi:DNA-binding MarR family transcriptional regulator
MSLEQDINQSKFKNEHEKAMLNIMYTNNWVVERLKAIFELENITMQQYNVLRIVRGATKAISTLQIRQRMIDKMSDTSRIVDRLAIKGLLKKSNNEFDKRLVDVTLSTKGKNLLSKFDAIEKQFFDILKNITETEAKTLNKLLEKLRA